MVFSTFGMCGNTGGILQGFSYEDQEHAEIDKQKNQAGFVDY